MTRGSCVPAAAGAPGTLREAILVHVGTQLTQESRELRQLSTGSPEGWRWGGHGVQLDRLLLPRHCSLTLAWVRGKIFAVKSSQVGRDPVCVLENMTTFGLARVSEVWTWDRNSSLSFVRVLYGKLRVSPV